MSRSLTAVYLLIFSLLFSHCDPERNTFGTYYVSLKVDVNKVSETIALGDTLKVTLQWPDVLQTQTFNGDSRTDNVNSLQYAWYGYRIFRIDTLNRTVYSNAMGDSTRLNFFLSEGYEHNQCSICYTGSAWTQKNNKPYRSVLNLVPKIKGVFYIEIIPQAGSFKINKNFEGVFSVNFNVPSKHANIIEPYLTGWEYVVEQRDLNGFGVYCFRVI